MAQRDPLVEYQREGYDLFAAMMDAIKEEIAGYLFNVQVTVEETSNEVSAKGLEAPKSLHNYSTRLPMSQVFRQVVEYRAMRRSAQVVQGRNISVATEQNKFASFLLQQRK